MRHSRKQIEDAITGLLLIVQQQVALNEAIIKALQKLEIKREEGRDP